MLCEVFYPERIEVIQTAEICKVLAFKAAATLLAEFCNKTKATSAYLSNNCGIRSQAQLSSVELEASLGLHATNNVAEGGHGGFTGAIQTWNGINLYHAAGEVSTRKNNDVGCGHEALISGRKGREESKDCVIGSLHKLPPELRELLFRAARENVKDCKRSFAAALKVQQEQKRRREEIAVEKKLDQAREKYIDSLYFF